MKNTPKAPPEAHTQGPTHGQGQGRGQGRGPTHGRGQGNQGPTHGRGQGNQGPTHGLGQGQGQGQARPQQGPPPEPAFPAHERPRSAKRTPKRRREEELSVDEEQVLETLRVLNRRSPEAQVLLQEIQRELQSLKALMRLRSLP